jgi:hypothetical protein
MFDFLNDLFLELSVSNERDEFILIQDKLLKETDNSDSEMVREIVQRKIDYYSKTNQKDKAREVLKENVHFESFRQELTEQLIAENDLPAAKLLVNDFIAMQDNKSRYSSLWHEFQLQIAQNENDMPIIQKASSLFLTYRFDANYYAVYKSTFDETEWPQAVEKLISQYYNLNKRWFNSSVADVLLAEKQEQRLMDYVEKYLSIDLLAKYYKGFATSFPENTLLLFKKTIDNYLQEYTGREHYELVLSMFNKIKQIKGGNNLVNEMMNNYSVIYKNRKAMMEILNRYSDV